MTPREWLMLHVQKGNYKFRYALMPQALMDILLLTESKY